MRPQVGHTHTHTYTHTHTQSWENLSFDFVFGFLGAAKYAVITIILNVVWLPMPVVSCSVIAATHTHTHPHTHSHNRTHTWCHGCVRILQNEPGSCRSEAGKSQKAAQQSTTGWPASLPLASSTVLPHSPSESFVVGKMCVCLSLFLSFKQKKRIGVSLDCAPIYYLLYPSAASTFALLSANFGIFLFSSHCYWYFLCWCFFLFLLTCRTFAFPFHA